MSEKTAEEKLRQELEGSITDSRKQETSQGRSKPKPRTRARASTSRKEMPENLGQRVDSFMDDFERMIEQSLSAVKSPSVSQEKPKPSRKLATARKKPSPETHVATTRAQSDILPEREPQPDIAPINEQTEIIPEAPVIPEHEPEPDIAPAHEQPEIIPESPIVPEHKLQPDIATVQAQPEIIPETPVVPEHEPEPDITPTHEQSETVPETLPIEPEILPEAEIIPEVEPIDYEPEPEFPDIPVIEADFSPAHDTTSDNTDTEPGLPDIPVITSDDDDADFDDFADDFTDDTQEPDNEPEPETPPEFQEAELLEAPEIVDDFTDDFTPEIDDFNDEPIDEEPAHIEPDEDDDVAPYDIDADEAGIFADDEPGEFEPPADVVLNVDDELPQISAQNEPDIDPEAESAPVTVTMPETTKTAEDKLMADIAEAMTGNPLSLDTQEQPGLYNIPENFFTDDANPEASPQSAEDKLKANIAQALSESPINTAQDHASQNLEDDINPFDDIDLPDSLMNFGDDDSEPEQDALTQDDDSPFDEPEPEFDESPEAETEPDFDAVPENEPDNDEEALDPFTIPDFPDDDGYAQPETDIEPLPELELDPEFEPAQELIPDIETVPELEPEPEPEIDEPDEPVNDDLPFTEDEALLPESEPLTEQDRLTQEIAAMTQEFDADTDTEDITPDNEPEFDIDATNEEAQQDNDMPEQTLLNDDAQETFDDDANDDWNIADLGELGEAATLADDDGDDFSMSGTEPQDFTDTAGIINTDEHKETEKTVNIREKLASRKNAGSDDAPAPKKKSSGSGGGGGILMPLLLGLLIAVGGMILWQLMQMSDKITSLAMNSTGYESVSGVELNPSYDYEIEFILDPNLTDRMRQRGRNGWQVVGSMRNRDATTGQPGYEFIFMRRTPGR